LSVKHERGAGITQQARRGCSLAESCFSQVKIEKDKKIEDDKKKKKKGELDY